MNYINEDTVIRLRKELKDHPGYEDCPECHGEGERETTIWKGEEGMRIEMDVPIICGECNGTGKIKIEDNTAVK